MGLSHGMPNNTLGIIHLLRKVKEAGFNHIELPFLKENVDIDFISMVIQQLKLQVCAIHASKDFLNNSIEKIAEDANEVVKYAETLNAKVIVMHPTSDLPSLQLLKTLSYPFKDYTIGIENTNLLCVDWVTVMKEYVNCGVTLDISHSQFLKQDIDHYFQTNVLHAHIRGFKNDEKYVRLQTSDYGVLKKLLYKQLRGEYEGKLVLEYPYKFLEDARKDLEIVLALREKIAV